MRQIRLHCETRLREDAALRLDGDAAHYLGNVLRMRQGHRVTVFNVEDGEFLARIEQLARQRVELRVGKLLRTPATPRLEIELCLGLCRGDRMARAIRKSTELGVSRITPFFSARGEVKLSRDRGANRLRHWRRIAVGAAEQSGGFRVPDLDEPRALDQVLQAPAPPDCARLLFDPAGGGRLPDSLANNRLRVITGPEGGFAEPELRLAAHCGYAVIALGPRVLRADTAPAAALAILQHRYGDMG